jgi:hypothetical protein
MKPSFMACAGFAACVGIAAVAAHAAGPTPVQSTSPLEAVDAALGTVGSATIYYTPAEDGYHVVATVQSAEPESQQVIRFTATLAAGQTAEISTPRGLGQPAAVIRIVRDGDQLRIEAPAG